MRRTSTASTRSAALTNAWLTGRVRGSASLQCAADVLASTTDFWLGSGGMDAGNDATGQIGGSFPLQQQQQLVWAASGNFGRSSRVPRGRGGGAAQGVDLCRRCSEPHDDRPPRDAGSKSAGLHLGELKGEFGGGNSTGGRYEGPGDEQGGPA